MKYIPACLLVIYCCLFICYTGSAEDLLLVDNEDFQLSFSLRIALLCDYEVNEGEKEFSISSAEISLEGRVNESLSCKLAIETGDAGEDFVLSQSDVYIQYDFHDYLSLRAGYFKVPFGRETFYGAGKRPYVDKTRTSGEIPPGRDIGVMCSGENILGLFGYDAGIFLGTEPDLPEDAENNYLAAGKLFALYKSTSFFSFELGYNMYYHYFFLDVSQHQLAQGLFSTMSVSFAKKNRLFLLAEYQERLRTRNVINQNMDWRRGVFVVAAYRYKRGEPFILLEWYNHTLLFTSDKDMFILKAGTAGYFLKKDLLKIKLAYEMEYPYLSEESSHKISALVQMDI